MCVCVFVFVCSAVVRTGDSEFGLCGIHSHSVVRVALVRARVFGGNLVDVEGSVVLRDTALKDHRYGLSFQPLEPLVGGRRNSLRDT